MIIQAAVLSFQDGYGVDCSKVGDETESHCISDKTHFTKPFSLAFALINALGAITDESPSSWISVQQQSTAVPLLQKTQSLVLTLTLVMFIVPPATVAAQIYRKACPKVLLAVEAAATASQNR